MKLPRTIRLDLSDTLIFERAAEPGEWAVPGGFMFLDADPAALAGKARMAFRSGFLGLGSFGWSTLVEVAEASPAEVEALISGFAATLTTRFGAPDAAAARAAAEQEIAFAASVAADHEVETLIALHRTVDDGGDLREQFRTLKRRERDPRADPLHHQLRVFQVVEEVDADAVEERIDLVGLVSDGRT